MAAATHDAEGRALPHVHTSRVAHAQGHAGKAEGGVSAEHSPAQLFRLATTSMLYPHGFHARNPSLCRFAPPSTALPTCRTNHAFPVRRCAFSSPLPASAALALSAAASASNLAWGGGGGRSYEVKRY